MARFGKIWQDLAIFGKTCRNLARFCIIFYKFSKSLPIFYQICQDSAIFGRKLWHFLPVNSENPGDTVRPENIWQDRAIFGKTWKYPAWSGSMWQYSTRFDKTWHDLAWLGNIWQVLKIFGHIWPDLAKSGNIWLHIRKLSSLKCGISGRFWNPGRYLTSVDAIRHHSARFDQILQGLAKLNLIWKDIARLGKLRQSFDEKIWLR